MFFFSCFPAAAGLNLPQRAYDTTLSDQARTKLQAYLGQKPATTTLPADLQQLLLESLPASMRGGCREIIEHWGTVAEGTATWSVRGLYRREDPDQTVLLLAFRCGSSYPDYGSYYDERLGLVSLDARGARLRLIPLAEDCDNCSDLYHLEFAEELALPEGTLAVLAMAFSSDNPCCDGPSQWRTEQLVYVVMPEGRVALTLDRVTERYDHDDVDGDTEEVCRSQITSRRVGEGGLPELLVETKCELNRQPVAARHRRFLWDPAARRFHEQGTQPPAR